MNKAREMLSRVVNRAIESGSPIITEIPVSKSQYIDEAIARKVRDHSTYASDGVCHNAQRGTFGHECGKPATWIGTKASGFRSGFCDHCKAHGDERIGFGSWQAI